MITEKLPNCFKGFVCQAKSSKKILPKYNYPSSCIYLATFFIKNINK